MKRPLRRYLLVSGIVLNAIIVAAALLFAMKDNDGVRHRLVAAAKAYVIQERAVPAAQPVGSSQSSRKNRPRIEELIGDVETFADNTGTVPAGFGYGRRLKVGHGQAIKTPEDAARELSDGDIVEILPGTYTGGTAVWRANDVIIRGLRGVVELDAKGTRLPQEKAIWIVRGDNYIIENIAFNNAKSRDRNGAGIRSEGTNLRVSNCYFRDNETALLAGAVPGSTIIIERSELSRNGHDDGQAHQIYVGRVKEAIFRFNYIHHAHVGSSIKSRADTTRVQYNRIVDGMVGTGNYTLDLSEGGRALVIGNVLQQSPRTNNYHLIAFAPERQKKDGNVLMVANNTFVNNRSGGVFIVNHTAEPALVYNNLVLGRGKFLDGPGEVQGNVFATRDTDTVVMSLTRFDYRLVPGSPAIDAGVVPPRIDGFSMVPDFEYDHPLTGRTRRSDQNLDVGAFEFGGRL